MQSETDRNRYAADEFDRLALRLESMGALEASGKARRCAVEIDLADAELQRCWGGAFNGQSLRTNTFEALTSAFEFAAIIETGTYRGITTSGIASRYSGPVLTCEINERYYLQAKANLAQFSNVQVELTDTVSFLTRLSDTFSPESRLLFYLDAHWYGHVPVVEELSIIQERFPRSVVMIDDFQVPTDEGYGFDDYGPGGRLDLVLLMPFRKNVKFFFPAEPSAHETGAKRGTCVLTWERKAAGILRKVTSLREATTEDWTIAQSERTGSASLELKGNVTAAELMSRFDEMRHLFNYDFATQSTASERLGGRLDELKRILEGELASRNFPSDRIVGQFDELRHDLATEAAARSSALEKLLGDRLEELEQALTKHAASGAVGGEGLITRIDESLSGRLASYFEELNRLVSSQLLERLEEEQKRQHSLSTALAKTQTRAQAAECELQQMAAELKRNQDLRQREVHLLNRLTADLETRLQEAEAQLAKSKEDGEMLNRLTVDLETRLQEAEAQLAKSKEDGEMLNRLTVDLETRLQAAEAQLSERDALQAKLAKNREDSEMRLAESRQEISALKRVIQNGEAERATYLDELDRVRAAYDRIANHPVILGARKIRSATRKIAGIGTRGS